MPGGGTGRRRESVTSEIGTVLKVAPLGVGGRGRERLYSVGFTLAKSFGQDVTN